MQKFSKICISSSYTFLLNEVDILLRKLIFDCIHQVSILWGIMLWDDYLKLRLKKVKLKGENRQLQQFGSFDQS